MKATLMKDLERLTKKDLVSMVLEYTQDYMEARTPNDTFEALLNTISPSKIAEREYFFTVTVDSAMKIIDLHTVSMGTLTNTTVHPREVFRPAILDNAYAVIIAHNHPSGTMTPSDADKHITRRLRQAGEVMGIQVVDHIIFSSTNYYSMLENKIF